MYQNSNNCMDIIEHSINSKINIEWELYNFNFDPIILFGVLYNIALDINCNSLSIEMFDKFPRLLKFLNFKNNNVKKLENYIDEFDLFLKNDTTLSNNLKYGFRYTYKTSLAKENYLEFSQKDLFNKIKEHSSQNLVIYTSDRQRNNELIKCMKKYYQTSCKHQNTTFKCECCNSPTFKTQSDEYFMEFHHIIPFGYGIFGPDHYLNLVGLCPSCHRKFHYLNNQDKSDLYNNLNNNNFLKISLIDRLLQLNKKKLLKSYHIEYLISEQAITDSIYKKLF